MIESLHIRNYAIIDELEIRFSEGLTIITGETGAGKSILLGALGLILGNRAETKSLYDESQKCVVEAKFGIERYLLQAFFADNDLDYENELVIRREITPSGKSRAFVNDTPVNLKILQQLSAALIDLHQQFDTLDIHNVSFQLRMIDALAGNHDRLEHYRRRYVKYTAGRRRLADMVDRNENAAKEVDFLNFQLEEFTQAELQASEQEELESELAVLSNAEEIKQTLAAAFQQLSESELSAIGQLEEIGQSLHQIEKYDPRLARLSERYSGMVLELRELANEFENIAEETEYDPERITEVQDRLDLIYRLQNKHKVASVEELLAIQAELEKKLSDFGDLTEEIAALESELARQEQELTALALALREARHQVIASFEQRVEQMLGQLAMEHARLLVEFSELEELSPTGLDEVNFLFAANKGSRLQLIKDVASGGELSRLTLVTKSLVASAIPLPSLVFDEIDTGISGDVALKMGKILRQLSDQHQVIVITHSPQVASKADAHYFVYKQVREERTVTQVRRLSDDQRVEVIATMLSQSPPSASALENARELLRQN